MDSQQDADAVILFVNFLLKLIEQSRAAFSATEFLKKVLDPDFVDQERYATLLVDESPQRMRTEIFIEAFRRKESGDGRKLAHFFKALWPKISPEDQISLISLITQELEVTDSEQTLRPIIQIMPPDVWPRYGEAARMRIENKLIASVTSGQYKSGKCVQGTLGTWVKGIHPYFSLKSELVSAIVMKLWSDDTADTDYLLNYLFQCLPDLEPDPSLSLVTPLEYRLEEGEVRFRNAILQITKNPENDKWEAKFKELLNKFVLKKSGGKFDDLEDDIPF